MLLESRTFVYFYSLLYPQNLARHLASVGAQILVGMNEVLEGKHSYSNFLVNGLDPVPEDVSSPGV